MDKTSYDFLDVLRGTIEDKVSTLDQTIYCKIVGINEDYTLDVTVVPDEITRIRSVVNASKYEFKVGDYGILYKIGNNLANAFIIAKLGPSYEDKASRLGLRMGDILDEDYLRLRAEHLNYRENNPLLPVAKLILGILSIIISILWLLQLIFYVFPLQFAGQSLYPFLNSLFSSVNELFPIFASALV